MIDAVSRVALGRTGLQVSRLGVVGGSSFMRATDGRTLIDAAWDAGLRYFDTAPLYGGGESERRFGEALSHRARERFVLSTKVGREGQQEYDYSAQGIARSIARSCGRLHTTRIDVALVHDVDPDMHGEAFEHVFRQAIDETFATLARLREAGVVTAIGVGLKDSRIALRLLRAADFDCVMLAGGYTLLVHDALDELLPYCARRGIGVVLAAPFNSGILASGAVQGARYFYAPAPPAILDRTRRIEQVCARHGVPLAAAALQFPLLHPAIASVVAGHEHPREVERNLASMQHPIPAALWAELKQDGLLPAHAPA